MEKGRMMEAYNKKLKEPSRRLRCEMTDAEQHLWSLLRRKQIHGVLFNRQKPILDYIVDFYCAKAKLVIELDGSQHYEPEHREKDQVRDQTLAELGLLVLRYDNRQVLLETEAVVEDIYAKVGERLGIPSGPPFAKGGM
jgi:very-short-patch-repair endonuclease